MELESDMHEPASIPKVPVLPNKTNYITGLAIICLVIILFNAYLNYP